jgi:hypothetical protein
MTEQRLLLFQYAIFTLAIFLPVALLGLVLSNQSKIIEATARSVDAQSHIIDVHDDIIRSNGETVASIRKMLESNAVLIREIRTEMRSYHDPNHKEP